MSIPAIIVCSNAAKESWPTALAALEAKYRMFNNNSRGRTRTHIDDNSSESTESSDVVVVLYQGDGILKRDPKGELSLDVDAFLRQVLPPLQKIQPKYVAFMGQPQEVGRQFVTMVSDLCRRIFPAAENETTPVSGSTAHCL